LPGIHVFSTNLTTRRKARSNFFGNFGEMVGGDGIEPPTLSV
jgi:hypothetical protein